MIIIKINNNVSIWIFYSSQVLTSQNGHPCTIFQIRQIISEVWG